jgi:hypothetical protein
MRDRSGPKTGEVTAIFGLPLFRSEWALWGITYPTFQIASITSNKDTCERVPRNSVTANKITPSLASTYLHGLDHRVAFAARPILALGWTEWYVFKKQLTIMVHTHQLVMRSRRRQECTGKGTVGLGSPNSEKLEKSYMLIRIQNDKEYRQKSRRDSLPKVQQRSATYSIFQTLISLSWSIPRTWNLPFSSHLRRPLWWIRDL